MGYSGILPAPELAGIDPRIFDDLRPAQLLVGYSGGLDSSVLLHWLASIRSRLPGQLRACHVDHGLQLGSSRWAQHCEAFCASLEIPLRVVQVNAGAARGESPEAAAREARYGALGSLLSQGDVLLTAHHRDDQVETLLLQLFRGAGPTGLGAMPLRNRFGVGWLLRPLLGVSRETLLAYAIGHGLDWVEDPSNADASIPRNWLRHQCLPALRARWPGLDGALARSAELCASAADMLDCQASADLQGIVTVRGTLSLSALGRLGVERQGYCVRRWLRDLALPLPGQRQLDVLLHTMISAAEDRQPCVRWSGVELHRFRGELYAGPPLPSAPTGQWLLPAPGELQLPGVGRLSLQASIGQGLASSQVPAEGLVVSFRQGGERFRPLHGAHHRSLKQWFQTWGVAPWERQRLPLIRDGERLLAVGERLAEGVQAKPGERSWLLAWQKAPLFVNV